MKLHYRRPDGSFVATVNGLPYHIVDGDPLFEEAQANGANLPLEPIPQTEAAAKLVSPRRVQING